MKQHEIEKFKKAKVCSEELAQMLTKCKVYPCTYYSCVLIGKGDLSAYQLVKTREALQLGFAHPAMTDFEARKVLTSFRVRINYVKYKSKKLRIEMEDVLFRIDLSHSLSQVDHMVFAICELIRRNHTKDWQVCNALEAIKIERNNET